MFTLIFLAACAVYFVVNLWLVRGLRILRAQRAETARRQAGAPTQPSQGADDRPLISVLIAARDEEFNLPRTLEALLAQEWPRDKTQLIVVNDRSTDGTARVLEGYTARHPGLIDVVHVTTLPPGLSPKKHALARGLEVARGSWIAVTDADCIMGPQWLSTMAAQFGPEAASDAGEAGHGARAIGMVVGPTAYEEPADGFTPSGGARALEFLSYGVSSAGLLGLGFPVIANANNIAYRRAAFDESGAFARHGGVVSGDDDFILQEIHATKRYEIRFCADPAAAVATTPPQTWAHFWEQRKRWAGKCVHYRAPQLAFLAFIYAFYLSIALLVLAGLFRVGDGTLGLLGLFGFAVKAAAEFLSMREGLSLLGRTALLRFFPFTSLIHIPLILAATAVGTLGSFTWKGQKLGAKA
jgi:cellulose synthase/poly-beta-1,6-N-acetylglucosamine synthase-like glycosyltransferase